ncbi:VOC family protein [Desulfosporosinus sp. SB140]|uniref:VOC family protein n=1 Tax=Desulfosporosinus paludis TaxID=3115649 RepID=UPI003890C10E
MSAEIKHIHHVGHVVKDMGVALEFYRKLGFVCLIPAYPMMAEKEGEEPKPLGMANTHITFLRNFIEIATVVKDEERIPDNANLVPIQVPPAVLPRVLENIKRTIDTVSRCLARYEGTHILCFYTPDVEASAARFDKCNIGHSGVNAVQRPVETTAGVQIIPIKVLEIDGEDVPEGRLAIADIPPLEILQAQAHMDHPNGAVELVEVILCVADHEIDIFINRYQRYLGRDVRADGLTRIIDLESARITIVPESRLANILPGEAAPTLPGFVGYVVKVRNISATRKYIEGNGLPVMETTVGDIFVPASAGLGTVIVFRQAGRHKF